MSELNESRCQTCNHKHTKHYWARESTLPHHDFMGYDGYCLKKKCHCDSYKMQAPELVSNITGTIIGLIAIILIGFVVVSCNASDSPQSVQCTHPGPRGPEVC